MGCEYGSEKQVAIDDILTRDRDLFLALLPHEVGYLIRVMEAAGLRALAAHLLREADKFPNPDEIGKIAQVLMHVSDTRMEYLAGRRQEKPDDAQTHMANAWDHLMWRIADPALVPPETVGQKVSRMAELLDYLDERASGGGITGEGWYRQLVKGI
jgi:hypothetical protein